MHTIYHMWSTHRSFRHSLYKMTSPSAVLLHYFHVLQLYRYLSKACFYGRNTVAKLTSISLQHPWMSSLWQSVECMVKWTHGVCYGWHYLWWHEHGPVTRYVKLRFAHAPGMPGTFFRPLTSKETACYWSRHASRHVRDARGVMHVGIADPRWREKRSQYSRHMRNPQFYVYDKRPMDWSSCVTWDSGDHKKAGAHLQKVNDIIIEVLRTI